MFFFRIVLRLQASGLHCRRYVFFAFLDFACSVGCHLNGRRGDPIGLRSSQLFFPLEWHLGYGFRATVKTNEPGKSPDFNCRRSFLNFKWIIIIGFSFRNFSQPTLIRTLLSQVLRHKHQVGVRFLGCSLASSGCQANAGKLMPSGWCSPRLPSGFL